MICPECAAENDDGVLFCRSCRTLYFGDRPDLPIPEEDERILWLAQMCEQLHIGDWDLPYFRDELANFTAEQERREAQVQAIYQHIPIGLEEDFQEEMDCGFQGVSAVRMALAQLSEYDPDMSPYSSMTSALATFYKGVCTVKEAMKINRRNRGRPLWI